MSLTNRIIRECREWGEANTSDPFAARVAMTHARIGLWPRDGAAYETVEKNIKTTDLEGRGVVLTRRVASKRP